MKIKKIFSIIATLTISLLFVETAATAVTTVAEARTIVINNIEMNNFMPEDTLRAQDEVYVIVKNDAFAIDFAPDISKFQIIILQTPYEENRQEAESEFVQKLHVTRNEACFLDVRVVAPAYVLDEGNAQGDDEAGTTSAATPLEKLSFCAKDKLADTNGDGVVNAFDYAVCLDELKAPPLDLKMACDLNVNRRIDATDFSQVITYLTKR